MKSFFSKIHKSKFLEADLIIHNSFVHAVGLSALLFFSGFQSASYILVSLYTALVIHELGHFLSARMLNEQPEFIYLSGFFGLTGFKNFFGWKKDLIVSVAGSGFNFIFSVLFFSVFFITDSLFFKTLAIVNLFFLIELMPVMPFDGGRVVDVLIQVFFKKSYDASRIISYIIGFVFLISASMASLLFVSGIFNKAALFSISMSLLMLSVFSLKKNLA